MLVTAATEVGGRCSEWRKEVALGRLKALTILIMLGAGSGATDGALTDDAADSQDTGSAARSTLPKPAADYLKAAAYLQNNGKPDEAAKYLKVAADHREELSPAERTVLDEYQKVLGAGIPAPTPAPALMPASAPVSEPPAPRTWNRGNPGAPTGPSAAGAGSQVMTLEGRTGTVDAKQRARWALANAVDLMRRQQYDDALAKVAEARGYNVKWTLFEDSPDKVAKAIAKARVSGGTTASAGHNKAAATARLKQARDLIKNNQYDQALAVAREVDSWNLGYGIWEDKPSTVIAAASALRRRDSVRKVGPTSRPSTDAYDSLVAESRTLLAAGRLDEAEAKAAQAQHLGVVPPVTADRAESVLRAVEVVRNQQQSPQQQPQALAMEPPPAAVSAAATLEREADLLLARQDPAAAAAKYTEAEQVQVRETGRTHQLEPLIAPPADLPAPPADLPAPDPLPAPSAIAPPAELAPEIPQSPANDPAAPAADPNPPGLAMMPGQATSPGEQFLGQARALFETGNFPAARELANRARQGGYGVETQADDLLTQINTKQQAAALALYEEALAAVRNQQFEHAQVLLNEVANCGALDDGFQQRVQDLVLKLSASRQQNAGAKAPIDTEADADAVAAQRLNAEVAVKVAEARHQMEIDPDKGIAILQETLTGIKASHVADAAKRTLTRRLEVALELAQKDKAAFELKMQDKTTREAVEAKKLRILEASKAKQSRVKEYMDKAVAAMSEGKYDEAESYAIRAQEVDPMDVAATALAWKARAQRGYDRDKDIRRRKEDGFVEAMQGASEAGVVDIAAYRNGISLPKNFAELSRSRREANARLEPKADPGRMAVERKLNEPITLDLEKQPLSEAVSFLQNATGLNVVLDPKAMLETGINENTPVSMRLKDVKLKTALKLMLAPLGLTYQSDDEVLVITSPQVSSRVVQRSYLVGDLVLPLSRRKKTADPVGAVPGVPTEVRAGVAPIQGTMPSTGKLEEEVDPSSVDFMPLMQLITATVAPGTWRAYDGKGGVVNIPGASGGQAFGMGAGFGQGFGGGPGGAGGGAGGLGNDPENMPPGAIIPYILNISLIIRHTPEVHEDIVDLLRQLRKLQDLQVSVEVRFITINDNFFERIGVDFDFAIQSETYGKHSSWTTLNPAAVPIVPGPNAQPVGPYLVNENLSRAQLGNRLPVVVGAASNGDTGIPRLSQDLSIPFLQDSYSLTNPFNALAGAGANFGISFLSDLDAYFFLTAAQGDSRSNIVQAPKVTTFNGAAATVFSGRTVNYVAQLIPVVNFGAVAFTPIPSQIFDGVQLTVMPVVSADRRYVRLTMSPFFSTIDGFDNFPVPAAVGGGGIGGASSSITGLISLPRQTIASINTTVTVPDGGTVLLGGVKHLREERQEYGVPILSKTPLINRLFRNIGIGRNTDSLMMMVTPRIIILEEEEERLGIPALAPNP